MAKKKKQPYRPCGQAFDGKVNAAGQTIYKHCTRPKGHSIFGGHSNTRTT